MTPYERMDIRQEMKRLLNVITSIEAVAKLEDHLINNCAPSDEEKEILTEEIKNRREQLQAMQDRRHA